jgi:nicotinate-nucleotide pyrophosphorylase (carboxylating)
MGAPFELPSVLVERAVAVAIEEDLASGDVTTEACILPQARAVAHAVARHALVVCGGPVFFCVFAKIDSTLVVESHVAEGARAHAGDRLWTVRGRARSILMGERVALNFVQRMCGIASMTRAYVDAVPAGKTMRVTDTRKTTPGLRALERYAVRVGGGSNHRDNLGAAVLIKDNHIAACGGIAAAIARARASASHTAKVECEVDTLDQLEEALVAGADIVLLDNMPTPMVIEAVARVRGRAFVETSGGIPLGRVVELANAGVDAVSIGALTHSAAAADVAIDFDP